VTRASVADKAWKTEFIFEKVRIGGSALRFRSMNSDVPRTRSHSPRLASNCAKSNNDGLLHIAVLRRPSGDVTMTDTYLSADNPRVMTI